MPFDEGPGAEHVLDGIKSDGALMAAHPCRGYPERRRELEALVGRIFVEKAGRPVRQVPHSMVVGACPWLETWYHPGDDPRVPLTAFEGLTNSFTYGDPFPTFSARVATVSSSAWRPLGHGDGGRLACCPPCPSLPPRARPRLEGPDGPDR